MTEKNKQKVKNKIKYLKTSIDSTMAFLLEN